MDLPLGALCQPLCAKGHYVSGPTRCTLGGRLDAATCILGYPGCKQRAEFTSDQAWDEHLKSFLRLDMNGTGRLGMKATATKNFLSVREGDTGHFVGSMSDYHIASSDVF